MIDTQAPLDLTSGSIGASHCTALLADCLPFDRKPTAAAGFALSSSCPKANRERDHFIPSKPPPPHDNCTVLARPDTLCRPVSLLAEHLPAIDRSHVRTPHVHLARHVRMGSGHGTPVLAYMLFGKSSAAAVCLTPPFSHVRSRKRG